MEAFNAKAKECGLPETEILPKEKERLTELAKRVGINYSWILICFIHQRNPQKDTELFEAVIEICQRVLEPAFEERNHKLFEDEIHRLFRTNEFNVTAHLKAFKVLHFYNNQAKYGLEGKQKAVRDPLNIRPLYRKRNERVNKSLNRSPLVSFLFPSGSDKTRTILEYFLICRVVLKGCKKSIMRKIKVFLCVCLVLHTSVLYMDQSLINT
eukprot:TRINITY_DN11721_c0_g1_i1.p1 TRINITY_DN11721_c0_g1~~TRINITY_DN11721_c0_g1_i1.p1  ORF type:complete len:211 (+),score=29.37 TRINITY_DN11721_c0_g1_i1:296-928(+)